MNLWNGKWFLLGGDDFLPYTWKALWEIVYQLMMLNNLTSFNCNSFQMGDYYNLSNFTMADDIFASSRQYLMGEAQNNRTCLVCNFTPYSKDHGIFEQNIQCRY